MKKYRKLLILVSLSILIVIAISIFTKPIHIQHAFGSGVSIKDNETTILNDDIKIELEGTISITDFNLSKMALRRDLKGTITINDKRYIISMVNYGSATHNLYWGALTEDSSPESKPIYMGYITNNLDTIYLSKDDEKYHIAAPANSIDDFNKIHEIINKSK